MKNVSHYDLLTKYKDKPIKQFAWFPKRMTDGTIALFCYYYVNVHVKSADPKHMWMDFTYLTEKDYFLDKLKG